MKYTKPSIDTKALEQILFDVFKENATEIEEAAQGQIAKTFSFTVGNKQYFIQFNRENMSHGFGIELRFSGKFREASIPVRNIVKQDYYNDFHYAITEKVQGAPLDSLSDQEFKSHIPQIMMTLFSISQVEIEDSKGFGWLDKKGNGQFDRWTDFLKFVFQEEPEDMFYGKWLDLFEHTFLEREKFHEYFAKMEALFNYLPASRSLNHGNYGYGNVFVHDNRISAVMDWQDAAYGDLLFDFAKFIFWLPDETQEILLKTYENILNDNSIETDHFQERIRCYKYYLGLDALRFFAKTDNKETYDYVIALLDGV